VALFSIDPIEFDEWTTLPHTQAKLIEELLNATSVVDVSTDEGPLFRILIQEEDMAHKPSMLLTLTAEEILRYWSLLSAEQREAFINDRASDLAIGTEISLPAQKLRGEETMFDRFAGIFHAFGRLEHHTAFQELAKFAENFDLILAVNVPTVRDEPLSQLSRTFGQLLGRQTPIGGMSGGVNQSLVRQFRMPGYPLLLVTTDVLQEGEDLHTFCANVIHYGISWTPSAMEQRTGRIDRIQSLTQRRLDNKSEAEEDKKLQVYYPHLKETVERLQVERV
jgi:hypothetical protein